MKDKVININDDAGLEREADIMGANANSSTVQTKANGLEKTSTIYQWCCTR